MYGGDTVDGGLRQPKKWLLDLAERRDRGFLDLEL